MRAFKPNRPTDKSIVRINKDINDTNQKNTVLITATFPCTVTGIRWNVHAYNETGNLNTFFWAIVLVKEGESAKAFGTGDGNTFYTPEQNCLAFGSMILGDKDGEQQVGDVMGSTKTMRKLQAGDQLMFICQWSIVDTGAAGSVGGEIMFFCKS